jgi:hypothetical protein
LNRFHKSAEREFEGLAMKIFLVYIALLTATQAVAEESENPTYCEEPKFSIRNDRLDNEARNLPLVSAEEAQDPQIGRKLASEPGPYGHSELGFRYLARLFGYTGGFGSKAEVENWLADQELKDYQNKKGLHDVWNEWVVNPAKRLSVPIGGVEAIPALAGPEIFFQNRFDQDSFDRCLAVRLKTMACENYLGDRKIESGDRVYFAGGASSRAGCKLVRNPYGYEAKRIRELEEQKSGVSGGKSNVSVKPAQ